MRLNKIMKVDQKFLLLLLILCISCNEESISKKALIKIILDGRSTNGIRQENEGMDNWKQIENILNI